MPIHNDSEHSCPSNLAGKVEWLTVRKTLLEHEKELIKHRDRNFQ
jgi:predicted dithiol-disulfide oxidoreductase (DUF899 family)